MLGFDRSNNDVNAFVRSNNDTNIRGDLDTAPGPAGCASTLQAGGSAVTMTGGGITSGVRNYRMITFAAEPALPIYSVIETNDTATFGPRMYSPLTLQFTLVGVPSGGSKFGGLMQGLTSAHSENQRGQDVPLANGTSPNNGGDKTWVLETTSIVVTDSDANDYTLDVLRQYRGVGVVREIYGVFSDGSDPGIRRWFDDRGELPWTEGEDVQLNLGLCRSNLFNAWWGPTGQLGAGSEIDVGGSPVDMENGSITTVENPAGGDLLITAIVGGGTLDPIVMPLPTAVKFLVEPDGTPTTDSFKADLIHGGVYWSRFNDRIRVAATAASGIVFSDWGNSFSFRVPTAVIDRHPDDTTTEPE